MEVMIAATYAMAIAVLVVAIIITGMIYRHLWEQGWRIRAKFSARRIGQGSWPLGATFGGYDWSEAYTLNVSLYLLRVHVSASVKLIKP